MPGDPKSEIKVGRDARSLSVQLLAACCRRETEKFRIRGRSDPRYCYELFRRALVVPAHPQRDDAWAALYDQYRPRLVRAAQKHQALACTGTSAAQIADRAFTRMWEAIGSRPGKFSRFKDLGALINYLHACVHSVIIDACRHGRSHVAGQPKDRDRIPQPPGRLELDEFWVEIRKHAKRAG